MPERVVHRFRLCARKTGGNTDNFKSRQKFEFSAGADRLVVVRLNNDFNVEFIARIFESPKRAHQVRDNPCFAIQRHKD